MNKKNNRKQLRIRDGGFFASAGFFRHQNSAGFTLVELVVVLAVSVMLTAILVTFNRGADRHIILINEQARLVQALTSAKVLSLQTFVRAEALGNVKTCGYGVHFEDRSYLVFIDSPLPDPLNSSCIDENNQYTGNLKFDGPIEVATVNQEFEVAPFLVYSLDPRVVFGDLPGGGRDFDVLFIPPEPTTYFYPAGMENAEIFINQIDGRGGTSVKITRFGQISAQ